MKMANNNDTQQTLPTNELIQAVASIKRAIVVSQSRALRMISGEQLSLYYGIGLYVSEHSRSANWGERAIEIISEQLQREMPGLRGFAAQSIRNMRTFAEFWSHYFIHTQNGFEKCSAVTSKLIATEKCSPVATEMPEPLRKSLPDIEDMAKLL